MSLVFSAETVQHMISSNEQLAVEILKDGIKSREKFVSRLSEYRGSRQTFSVIIYDALAHHDITMTEMAQLCEANQTTISRWARGAAPSRLARIEVVNRLRAAIQLKLVGLNRLISTPIHSKGAVRSK